MGFSRQEYWSGLLCPSPGDLPQQEIEPASLVSFACKRMLYHWATRETPGAVGYPAFAPGSLEVAVGLLVFLYLAHNLSQLHMCVIIFINSLIISHYFVAWGINASTTAKGPRSQVPGCLTHSIRPQPSTRKPSEGWQLGPVHREPTKCTPPPRQGWLGSAPSGGKRTSTLTLHMSCLRSQTPRRHLGCTEASEGGLPLEGAGSKEAFHSWTSPSNVRISPRLRDEGSSHQGPNHSLTSESGVTLLLSGKRRTTHPEPSWNSGVGQRDLALRLFAELRIFESPRQRQQSKMWRNWGPSWGIFAWENWW